MSIIIVVALIALLILQNINAKRLIICLQNENERLSGRKKLLIEILKTKGWHARISNPKNGKILWTTESYKSKQAVMARANELIDGVKFLICENIICD